MVHDFPSVQGKDQFLELVDSLKAKIFRFILSEDQWRSVETTQLTWEEVKFNEECQNEVPMVRGVYAFIVRHQNGFFPNNHGYIMYIGETGNDKPHRNLRTRFGEYLKEGKIYKKRPKVYMMLSSFKNDLFFAYSTIEDLDVDTKEIEMRLCDAILPWAVINDFSAEMRPVAKAVWS